MRTVTLLLYFLLGNILIAQNTITGTFSPAKDYSWLIAYRLKPGTQVYAADTAIKDGKFNLNLPENAQKGTYRLVYSIPQEEFYFDVIYTREEAINLNFERDKGVTFIESNENILFSTYFKEIYDLDREIIEFYTSGSTNKKNYEAILKSYRTTQEKYENLSEGLLVSEFIKANKPYIPTKFESIYSYVNNRKQTYFTHLNVTNPNLQASGYLTDKLANYVFTALPLEPSSQEETENVIQANVTEVVKQLKGVSETYHFHLLYTLWTQSIANGFVTTADFIYETYLQESPLKAENQIILNQIETYNRLRIGAIAPEIQWTTNKEERSLHNLEGAENYLIVFWSSTCSHCLKELPALHKELQNYSTIKTIAVGIEDSSGNWEKESAKLDQFEHLIALGKWDSAYAKLYDIQATPSYYLLDADKKIIAKPETDKEVIEILRAEN